MTVDVTARSAGIGRSVFERAAGDIELRELRETPTAVLRVETDSEGMPAAIGRAFGEVAGALGRAGVRIEGPAFTRYLSWGPDAVVAEVGFGVAAPIAPLGRVVPSSLPGGITVSAVHVGPYDTLAVTYERIQAWFAEHGRQAADVMWEVYWSEPVGDPSTWRTEICWPVRQD